MTVREGMAPIIARTRRLADDAGSAVWTSDDTIQEVLDQYRQRVYREPLEMELTYTSGTSYVYKVYHSRYGDWEEGGTTTFQVEDSAGSQRGTDTYTADYVQGVITMDEDQKGTALYLTGWTHDVHAAARDLWVERAGMLANRVDVDTGDQRMNRSQWFDHCQAMARLHGRQARPVVRQQWTVGDPR